MSFTGSACNPIDETILWFCDGLGIKDKNISLKLEQLQIDTENINKTYYSVIPGETLVIKAKGLIANVSGGNLSKLVTSSAKMAMKVELGYEQSLNGDIATFKYSLKFSDGLYSPTWNNNLFSDYSEDYYIEDRTSAHSGTIVNDINDDKVQNVKFTYAGYEFSVNVNIVGTTLGIGEVISNSSLSPNSTNIESSLITYLGYKALLKYSNITSLFSHIDESLFKHTFKNNSLSVVVLDCLEFDLK